MCAHAYPYVRINIREVYMQNNMPDMQQRKKHLLYILK